MCQCSCGRRGLSKLVPLFESARARHQHPIEGYRRLTFMMLDDDVVAVSPAKTYRGLARAEVVHDGLAFGLIQPVDPAAPARCARWPGRSAAASQTSRGRFPATPPPA